MSGIRPTLRHCLHTSVSLVHPKRLKLLHQFRHIAGDRQGHNDDRQADECATHKRQLEFKEPKESSPPSKNSVQQKNTASNHNRRVHDSSQKVFSLSDVVQVARSKIIDPAYEIALGPLRVV